MAAADVSASLPPALTEHFRLTAFELQIRSPAWSDLFRPGGDAGGRG